MPAPPTTDYGNIRQQIGEIHATVQALGDQIQELREERRENSERMWMELRTMKHDERQTAQVISGRVELVDRRVENFERGLQLFERELKEARTAFEAEIVKLRAPLEDFINLRARAGWIFTTLVFVGTILWWIAEPIYNRVIGLLPLK